MRPTTTLVCRTFFAMAIALALIALLGIGMEASAQDAARKVSGVKAHGATILAGNSMGITIR